MRRLSQKGFSLIELMVVVAIIGILAAIAVPNFQNFIVKSRQAEAKANLGALYACEAAFFAEWNQYFADFRDIGLMPEGSLTYNFGFSAAGAVNAPAAPYTGITIAGAAPTIFVTTGNCGGALPRCTLNAMATAGGAVPGVASVTAVGTFVAAATANLDSDATLDQWQIDQNKTLVLVNPATTNDLL